MLELWSIGYDDGIETSQHLFDIFNEIVFLQKIIISTCFLNRLIKRISLDQDTSRMNIQNRPECHLYPQPRRSFRSIFTDLNSVNKPKQQYSSALLLSSCIASKRWPATNQTDSIYVTIALERSASAINRKKRNRSFMHILRITSELHAWNQT